MSNFLKNFAIKIWANQKSQPLLNLQVKFKGVLLGVIDACFWLGLCVAMIGFSFIVKFYFGVMKFDIDKASLNLKKLILQ